MESRFCPLSRFCGVDFVEPKVDFGVDFAGIDLGSTPRVLEPGRVDFPFLARTRTRKQDIQPIGDKWEKEYRQRNLLPDSKPGFRNLLSGSKRPGKIYSKLYSSKSTQAFEIYSGGVR